MDDLFEDLVSGAKRDRPRSRIRCGVDRDHVIVWSGRLWCDAHIRRAAEPRAT